MDTTEATWIVQVEEDGMGEVVWTGLAADALEAVRAWADDTGVALPRHPLDDLRDVNRDGSRYESEGPVQLVVERVR